MYQIMMSTNGVKDKMKEYIISILAIVIPCSIYLIIDICFGLVLGLIPFLIMLSILGAIVLLSSIRREGEDDAFYKPIIGEKK